MGIDVNKYKEKAEAISSDLERLTVEPSATEMPADMKPLVIAVATGAVIVVTLIVLVSIWGVK